MERIIQQANLNKAIIFTIIFAVFYSVINFTAIGVAGLLQITGGANILDFEFGYTGQKAYEMLAALGEQGRSFYLTSILPLDFLFPVSYMLCFGAWISYLVKLLAPYGKIKYSLLAPVLAMIFDWFENISIITMLKSYPSLPAWAVRAASVAGIIKTVCTVASVAVIVILFVAYLLTRNWKAPKGGAI